QIIAASFREVFPETSSVRDVSISREVRRTQWVDGPCWRVCMKADAKNMNGDYIGLRTYVVAIRRNKVFDRRRAEPEDGCESEKYEPFIFLSPVGWVDCQVRTALHSLASRG